MIKMLLPLGRDPMLLLLAKAVATIISLILTLLHLERPKLYGVLAFLSVIGLNLLRYNNFYANRKHPGV